MDIKMGSYLVVVNDSLRRTKTIKVQMIPEDVTSLLFLYCEFGSKCRILEPPGCWIPARVTCSLSSSSLSAGFLSVYMCFRNDF